MTADDIRIGDSFAIDGQHYEVQDWHEHEIPARMCILYDLRTTCPDCGVGFWATAGVRAIKQKTIRRRCDGCRKPGVRVRPRPIKKTKRRAKK
jgi:hypothetical protein